MQRSSPATRVFIVKLFFPGQVNVIEPRHRKISISSNVDHKAITWANFDPGICRFIAPPGHDELIL